MEVKGLSFPFQDLVTKFKSSQNEINVGLSQNNHTTFWTNGERNFCETKLVFGLEILSETRRETTLILEYPKTTIQNFRTMENETITKEKKSKLT